MKYYSKDSGTSLKNPQIIVPAYFVRAFRQEKAFFDDTFVNNLVKIQCCLLSLSLTEAGQNTPINQKKQQLVWLSGVFVKRVLVLKSTNMFT